ncbi:hypothetical protein KAR91_15285, partial [Candidatus Pacearchaeota archaeon]|nr:hypothetical protein [Candidatus Pacearchaeota archaeon]
KYASIEINLNYQEQGLAAYFCEEFDLSFDIGQEPYQFGKHTFKNVSILEEQYIVEIINNNTGEILFSLKNCYFNTAELIIVKIGKLEIPMLKLVLETECDHDLNHWLFQSLQTVLSIAIKQKQKTLAGIIPEKLKKDIKSGKVTTESQNSSPQRDPKTGRMISGK